MLLEAAFWGALNALPSITLVVAYVLYRRDARALSPRRRVVCACAFVATAVSCAVLLGFLIHVRLIGTGLLKPVDVDRSYPVLTMLVLALLGAILAVFGRGMSRWLLAITGLLVLVLWYLAAMAASP